MALIIQIPMVSLHQMLMSPNILHINLHTGVHSNPKWGNLHHGVTPQAPPFMYSHVKTEDNVNRICDMIHILSFVPVGPSSDT